MRVIINKTRIAFTSLNNYAHILESYLDTVLNSKEKNTETIA